MSILHFTEKLDQIIPKERTIVISKNDHEMTTMINGVLHMSILCISLVLVVVILQHAALFLHVSFSNSGRDVYNI